MLRYLLSSLAAFAIFLGAISLAPKVYADEAEYSELTETFNLLASHYNLTGDIDDYGFIYWYDKKGTDKALALRIYENPNSVVSLHTNNSRVYYTSSNPSTRCYCIFHGGNTGNLFSNDESNTNITFYDSKQLFGSFDNFSTLSGVTYTRVYDAPTVDTVSNANLLAGLYDITFTPTVSFPADFPLIGKSLKVAPVAVRDDTGYNLISLQVPQLGTYTDVIVFGEYHFVPSKSSSETYFDGLKFSFGSDPLNENDDEYDGTITPSMFSCVVDGQPLRSKGMTVNSLSFFYNTKLQKYSNRVFTIFDYSSTDSNIYPSVRFMGIGSINGMSAGSICYNCDFSGLVSPDSPSEVAEEGRQKTEDTIEELGYVPIDVSYPDPSEGFTFDDPDSPDFSALGNIFSFMFNNRIIRAMLEMCLIVGLAGYVMYGKKGD